MMPREFAVVRQVLSLLRKINISPLYFVVPTLLSLGAAAAEGASIGLLVPMLNGFQTQDFSFIKDVPVLGGLLSFVPGGLDMRDRTLFIFLIAVFSIAILLKNVLRLGAATSMSFLATRSLHHLRKELFNRYLQFGKLFFDQTSVGHHSTVLTQFSMYAMLPLTMIDKFVNASLSLLVYFVVMLAISWKVTLIAIPLFLILHFAVRSMVTRIQELSKSIAASQSNLSKKVVEILSLVPLVQSSNMEEEERRRYSEISNESASLEFKKHVVQQTVRPIQELISLLAILLLFSGMLYLLVREQATMATSFLVYFYIVLNATNKFGAFTSFRGDVMSVSGAIDEVLAVFKGEGKHFVPDGPKKFTGLRQGIWFNGLTFSYGGDRDVLNALTFDVAKGASTAIVGPTGAGKTTIISLLLRYYDCPPNSILFDGVDIREFTIASLRSKMALVSQDTLLLHDTLRNNILYGLTGVSEERLTGAVRSARLEDYVNELPAGLETLIGDRGVKLSGGEKQRVSIARSLLKDADILILDEATSSLDSKTEKLIQAAIDEAIQGRTAIVIAHRLATIKNADKIVVIDDGKCVEEGTLEALLQRKGQFYEYWQEQKFF